MSKELNGTWKKHGNDAAFFVGPSYITQPFTVEELEEALRVAREKPLFTARGCSGVLLEYQKQGGVVMLRTTGVGFDTVWRPATNYRLDEFSADELEAIAKAMRS